MRITWSLKGDIISSEPSMTTTMLGTRVSMLMISSVGYRHSGTYTCSATNSAGTASFSTELKVNGTKSNLCGVVCGQGRHMGQAHQNKNLAIIISEPPQIVPFTFGTDTINEGDVAQLVCLVRRGDEPLRITWSLKGDIISSEPAMTTTMIGTRTSMLMISSVGYRHSGTYTCTASNDAGTDSFSAELKVKGT